MMAAFPVLIAEDAGPALVGLLRPHIVVPRWLVTATPDEQELVIAHERSHLEAGDAQLLTIAVFLLICMPWNLPLWWQLRRLRRSIEMDCDARVLKHGHNISRYGEVLIAVGGKAVHHHRGRRRDVGIQNVSGTKDTEHAAQTDKVFLGVGCRLGLPRDRPRRRRGGSQPTERRQTGTAGGHGG